MFCSRVYELDAKWHVLGGVDSALLRVHAMMRPEACLRAQHGCAGDALLEQQRKNLTAQDSRFWELVSSFK